MKHDKKKNHQKDKKDDLSEPLLKDNPISPYDSDYRRKQRNRKSDWKKNPLKLCVCLTAELLTTVYKLKTSGSNCLQISVLTFLESLEMIFSQYKESCEVPLDYPRIGGENV